MAERPRSSGADWKLGSAEEQHERHPRSFFIPSRSEREGLRSGDDVRLLFVLTRPREGEPTGERMWLEIESRDEAGYVGILKNQPAAIEDLTPGDRVRFGPEHILTLDNPEWKPYEDKRAFATLRLLDDDELEPLFVRHDPSDEGQVQRATGDTVSGWEVYVGDETDEELADPDNVVLSRLAWLMERYPAFGDLVFSGARDGAWDLIDGAYRRVDAG